MKKLIVILSLIVECFFVKGQEHNENMEIDTLHCILIEHFVKGDTNKSGNIISITKFNIKEFKDIDFTLTVKRYYAIDKYGFNTRLLKVILKNSKNETWVTFGGLEGFKIKGMKHHTDESNDIDDIYIQENGTYIFIKGDNNKIHLHKIDFIISYSDNSFSATEEKKFFYLPFELETYNENTKEYAHGIDRTEENTTKYIFKFPQ